MEEFASSESNMRKAEKNDKTNSRFGSGLFNQTIILKFEKTNRYGKLSLCTLYITARYGGSIGVFS